MRGGVLLTVFLFASAVLCAALAADPVEPAKGCGRGSIASESGRCRLCAAGTFSAGGSATRCQPCRGGFSSTRGAGRCNACKAGFGGPSCSACKAGMFSKGGLSAQQNGCGPCPVVKLMECWTSSPCLPDKGLIISPQPAGTPCRNNKGTCSGNGTCVCLPGHGGWNCDACGPNSWSPGLPQAQNCTPCPSQPACKKARGPCEQAPPCDNEGRPLDTCWVSAPDGTDCSPTPGGDSSQHWCQRSECIPKSEGPNDTLCPPGTGGQGCTPCSDGFWSAGARTGTPCQACPQQALCRRMGTPCERVPPCDKATGKPTGMCFVPRPPGAPCNPSGPMSPPLPGYSCVADSCVKG